MRLTERMKARRSELAERLKGKPEVDNPWALATSILQRKRLKEKAKEALKRRG